MTLGTSEEAEGPGRGCFGKYTQFAEAAGAAFQQQFQCLRRTLECWWLGHLHQGTSVVWSGHDL